MIVAADQRLGGVARIGVMCLVASVLLTRCCVVAAAPATAPAVAGEFENQPIRRGAAPTSNLSSAEASSSQTARGRSHDIVDVQRVMLALLAVLGLIFFLRWTGKRFFPNAIAARAAGAVRVLARSPVSGRQQVLLVQVGRRVLVIADNGTQMSALSEITDPDEIAHLVGQLSGGGSATSATREAFNTAFGAAKEEFDQTVPRGDDESEQPDEAVDSTRGEIDGLMEKVRGLARQLGRSS